MQPLEGRSRHSPRSHREVILRAIRQLSLAGSAGDRQSGGPIMVQPQPIAKGYASTNRLPSRTQGQRQRSKLFRKRKHRVPGCIDRQFRLAPKVHRRARAFSPSSEDGPPVRRPCRSRLIAPRSSRYRSYCRWPPHRACKATKSRPQQAPTPRVWKGKLATPTLVSRPNRWPLLAWLGIRIFMC